FTQPLSERLGQHPRFTLPAHLRLERIRRSRKLVAQLQIILPALRIEPPVGQRRAHGAAGLALMSAVAEAAFLRERVDVRELALVEVFLARKLDLAHARRIDQTTAGR